MIALSNSVTAFWAAVGGALIGSVFSLVGVRMTLKWEKKRDEAAKGRRLKDARSQRLRNAYRELSAASASMELIAARIALTATLYVKDEPGGKDAYIDQMARLPEDVSQARAALTLEVDEDRAALDAFDDAGKAYTAVWLRVSTLAVKKEMVPTEEFTTLMDRLHTAVEKVAELARNRLAQLDRPA